MLRRTVLSALLATAIFPIAAHAAVEAVARGTQVRKDLLNALRPLVSANMRTEVEFVVRTMNLWEGWAFLIVDPQKPGGAPIDPSQTIFAGEADLMDGLTVYALLESGPDGWVVREHITGPTDVAYVPWPDAYNLPAALFDLR